MITTPGIRNLFKPIQPSVIQTDANIFYIETLPALQLQSCIYCYWELKTEHPLANDFTYNVVADGCIDLFFELNNPQESFVMGFSKSFSVFPLGKSFHYIGVRFLPASFPQLFKINAVELSPRSTALHLIHPPTASFLANCFSFNQSKAQNIKLLDDWFMCLVSKTKFACDTRFSEAIDIILKNGGVLNIERDLQTGISPRQLRRLFEFYIGDTAKTFSQVVRFQNILKTAANTQILKKQKPYYNAGYYDQAHFIKEFKSFYGLTPAKAFGNKIMSVFYNVYITLHINFVP